MYIFIADNISISVYVMCVILCLLTAFSCMVGTLQISIIIIMANSCYTWAERGTKTKMEIVICML